MDSTLDFRLLKQGIAKIDASKSKILNISTTYGLLTFTLVKYQNQNWFISLVYRYTYVSTINFMFGAQSFFNLLVWF